MVSPPNHRQKQEAEQTQEQHEESPSLASLGVWIWASQLRKASTIAHGFLYFAAFELGVWISKSPFGSNVAVVSRFLESSPCPTSVSISCMLFGKVSLVYIMAVHSSTRSLRDLKSEYAIQKWLILRLIWHEHSENRTSNIILDWN